MCHLSVFDTLSVISCFMAIFITEGRKTKKASGLLNVVCFLFCFNLELSVTLIIYLSHCCTHTCIFFTVVCCDLAFCQNSHALGSLLSERMCGRLCCQCSMLAGKPVGSRGRSSLGCCSLALSCCIACQVVLCHANLPPCCSCGTPRLKHFGPIQVLPSDLSDPRCESTQYTFVHLLRVHKKVVLCGWNVLFQNILSYKFEMNQLFSTIKTIVSILRMRRQLINHWSRKR